MAQRPYAPGRRPVPFAFERTYARAPECAGHPQVSSDQHAAAGACRKGPGMEHRNGRGHGKGPSTFQRRAWTLTLVYERTNRRIRQAKAVGTEPKILIVD